MYYDELMISAKSLENPSEAAVIEFSEKKELLTEMVVQLLEARKDIEKLIGENNLSMMKDNAHNMARFMESIFGKYSPKVFVETILWVFRAYRSHGFQLTFWSAHLNAWMQVNKQNLSEKTYNEINPYYSWMQVNIPVFVLLTEASKTDEK